MEKEFNSNINKIEMKDLTGTVNEEGNHAAQKLSDFGSYFSIFKSIVAMGILYLPYGFSKGGIVFSIIALIFSAILTYIGYIRIVKASSKLNTDFSGIAFHTMGYKGKLLIDFILTISQISLLIYYFIYITHSILEITNQFELNVSETTIFFFQSIFFSALFIPLTLKKGISWLAPFHFLADFIIVIFAIIISICSIILVAQRHSVGEGIISVNYKGMLVFFGMSVFSFEGIGTIIPIYKSMKNPQNFKRILIHTFIIIFILYNLMGIIGYLAFGSNIPDIQINYVLLQNAGNNHSIYMIIFIFTQVYMLNLIPSFALNAYPPFRIIDKAISNFVKKPQSSSILQAVVTSILVVIIIITGIALRNRGGAIISLIGSILGASLGFIFPGIFSLCLDTLSKYEKFKNILLISVGVIAGTFGSINSILI